MLRSQILAGLALAAVAGSGVDGHATPSTPTPPVPYNAALHPHENLDSKTAVLHCPLVVGASPGSSFHFRIAATGQGPLTFTAKKLPFGLRLDKQTGVISGQAPKEGTYTVKLSVRNAYGSDHHTLKIVSGVASGSDLERAEEATDFIQKHFYDSAAQRYHPEYPVDPKKLPWDFMWGNGVILSDLALAARHDPAKYKDDLYTYSASLQANYWDPASPVPGFNAYCSGPNGTDKYYDDNSWVVRDYLEAYDATQDRQFLDLARKTQAFVLSGWDDVLGGGIYWRLDHKNKGACANAPTIAGALKLAQIDGDVDELAWADAIRAWVDKRLQAPDGLYYDGLDVDGKLSDYKWSYNAALMIISEGEYYRIDHDPADLKEIRRIADAALARWQDPSNGSLHKTEDSPLFIQLLCEALLRIYDLTGDKKYLEAVRHEADFAYTVGRNPSGGYWQHWTSKPHEPSETQTLIIDASAARIFWLLSDYPEESSRSK